MTEPIEPFAATGRRPGLWQRAWRAVAAVAQTVQAAPARLRRYRLVGAKLDSASPTTTPRPAQSGIAPAPTRAWRGLDRLPWWLQDYLDDFARAVVRHWS